jgi:hypothetical protein
MPVKTSKVMDRRQLRFGRMEEILRDAQNLATNGPEKIRAVGNWTPAQVVYHVAVWVKGSIDGFDFRAPLLMRVIGRMIKSSALNKPLRPGFKIQGKMQTTAPPEHITWEYALSLLKAQIDRIQRGDRMRVPSPMFGELSHEEWIQLHCRHAEMHFSFLHPGK